MEIQALTKKFAKKNIPDVKVGDTVRVSFKITEGSKTRIQAFEGLVIALKHGKGLDGTIKIRKVSGGIGVERTFPLHSPLIVKFEKTKSTKVRRSKLYFVREMIGKKKKTKKELKEYGMWEEAVSEEELAKIEEEKAKAAELKAQAKAEKEKELEEKFAQAAAAHQETAEVKEEK
jgi:large subunit ribosomal protein L19